MAPAYPHSHCCCGKRESCCFPPASAGGSRSAGPRSRAGATSSSPRGRGTPLAELPCIPTDACRMASLFVLARWRLKRETDVSAPPPLSRAPAAQPVCRQQALGPGGRAVRYGAMKCDTVLYGAVRCDMVPYSAVRCDMVQYGAIRCRTVRYGTVQCSRCNMVQ